MIELRFGEFPNGVPDPRVCLDGVDVTMRCFAVHLYPLGRCSLELLDTPPQTAVLHTNVVRHRTDEQPYVVRVHP